MCINIAPSSPISSTTTLLEEALKFDNGNEGSLTNPKLRPMRKRPKLKEARSCWKKMKRPVTLGNLTSGESNSALDSPEPDSTMEDDDITFISSLKKEVKENDDKKNDDQITLLKTNHAEQDFSKPKTHQNFSLLLHMSKFEPWQITVKVQPDKRILEVRGTHEIEGFKETQSYCTNSGSEEDFERLEYVKHLKVPANVDLEKMVCTLDQNGWLKVEAPTKSSKHTLINTSSKTLPDQSDQWSAARLIPVNVIHRKHLE